MSELESGFPLSWYSLRLPGLDLDSLALVLRLPICLKRSMLSLNLKMTQIKFFNLSNTTPSCSPLPEKVMSSFLSNSVFFDAKKPSSNGAHGPNVAALRRSMRQQVEACEVLPRDLD